MTLRQKVELAGILEAGGKKRGYCVYLRHCTVAVKF